MMLTEQLVADEQWMVNYDQFSPELEGAREALCATGNGFFCTRAAALESVADDVHYPATYLAGGYNRVKVNKPDSDLYEEQLVNLPNWLAVNFKIDDGEWFNLKNVEIIKYQQRLDLRQAIVYRDIRFRDAQGRETSIAQRIFVNMRLVHLASLEVTWTAHNWSGELTIRSALEGRVSQPASGGSKNETHLEYTHNAVTDGILSLVVTTKQSRLTVSEAASHNIFIDDKPQAPKQSNLIEPGYVGVDFKLYLARDSRAKLHKTVALFTSRDRGISEPAEAARAAVIEAPPFEVLLIQQLRCWGSLWRQFELFVDTKDAKSHTKSALLLHLNTYHVLQVASPNIIDLDTGLPARGWTGEGYQGHVFWDALFVFPFINFRAPKVAEALMKYRYRRLDSARAIARQHGNRGARFPWQSGSDGREDTPTFDWNDQKKAWSPDNSGMQIHVNSAIVHDIWQYYQVTADLEFMKAYGAEIILEIARFFASFSDFSEKLNRFEIHGVVGPDEFHTAYPGAKKFGINNNAYTNIMAVATFVTALELIEILPSDHRDELLERLEISKEEIAQWDDMSKRMFIPFTEDGLISQFEGYEKLKPFPCGEDGTIDMTKLNEVLQEEGGTPNEFAVGKQADVLLLFYLFSSDELKELFHRLGYSFECSDIRKNVEYYLPKTANQSTLSRIAHAWVLSRLDRRASWNLLSGANNPRSLAKNAQTTNGPRSWPVLLEALDSDFSELHHAATRDGIHMGAMGGTLDIVQRCYTGMVARKDVLWFNPRLPDALSRLNLSIQYRGQALRIEITHEELEITALHSSTSIIKIGMNDKIFEVTGGDRKSFSLNPE
jgi:alpha,alpha-trehalase